MSLIDALLLDPAPLDVWIAFRTDGRPGLAPGLPAMAMLQRVIREGEPRQRAAAVEAIGMLADRDYIQDIGMGLSDNENSVRSLAFEALWALRTQHEEAPKE